MTLTLSDIEVQQQTTCGLAVVSSCSAADFWCQYQLGMVMVNSWVWTLLFTCKTNIFSSQYQSMPGHNVTGTTVLVSGTPRRGVSRHREDSSTASSTSSHTTVTSRQFSYSHKLNSTCQFSSHAEFDSGDFQDVLELVRSDLTRLRREMVFTDCYGASLSSLPASPGMDHVSLHLSLTNILAHFFVMRMDWLLSTGLPCLVGEKEIRVRHLHNRLVPLVVIINFYKLKHLLVDPVLVQYELCILQQY